MFVRCFLYDRHYTGHYLISLTATLRWDSRHLHFTDQESRVQGYHVICPRSMTSTGQTRFKSILILFRFHVFLEECIPNQRGVNSALLHARQMHLGCTWAALGATLWQTGKGQAGCQSLVQAWGVGAQVHGAVFFWRKGILSICSSFLKEGKTEWTSFQSSEWQDQGLNRCSYRETTFCSF